MNANQQLVDASGLLKALFEEDCRPSLRWLRDQQKAGTIPCRRLGRLVFFDLDEVRAALAAAHSEHYLKHLAGRPTQTRKES